jgi:hypothetical protein
MKCKFALKNRFSDFILVKTKKKIEDHIADCSFCSEQVAKSDEVETFFKERKGLLSPTPDHAPLLHDIRNYREERERSWWYTIMNVLPLEPAYRRGVLYGTACLVIMMGSMVFNIPDRLITVLNPAQTSGEALEEHCFYLLEHVLTQESDLFGDCTISKTLVNLDKLIVLSDK